MREIVDRCNICNSARGAGNHWLLMVEPANASPYFVSWDDARASEDGIGHICGATCAHSALDTWLTKQQAARTAKNEVAIDSSDS